MTLDNAVNEYNSAAERVYAAVRSYARAETIKFSQRHPKRTVTFVQAMGSRTLHVEVRGLGWNPNNRYYMLTADGGHTGSEGRMPIPEFLTRIEQIEEETGLKISGDPLRIVCKGGQLIERQREW